MKKSNDAGMIDLGVSYESKPEAPTPAKKGPSVSYPTLYLPSSTKDLPEFPDGEFYFMCKGTVKRCVETYENGKETYSCDIEVHGLKVMDGEMGKGMGGKMKKEMDADESLDEELTKIESNKRK